MYSAVISMPFPVGKSRGDAGTLSFRETMERVDAEKGLKAERNVAA